MLERYANAAVNDQLLRIGHDGAAKIPVFHTKTVETLLKDGGALDREAFLFAAFAGYLKGRDDKGETFPVIEPRFTEADWALVKGGDPLGVLARQPVHPPRPRRQCRLRRAVHEIREDDRDSRRPRRRSTIFSIAAR